MVMKSILTTAAIAGIAASLYSSYRRRSGSSDGSRFSTARSSNMGNGDDAGLAEGMSGSSPDHRDGGWAGTRSSPGMSSSTGTSQDFATTQNDLSTDDEQGRTDDLLSPTSPASPRSF